MSANGITTVVNVHGTSAIARPGAKRWSPGTVVGGLAMYDCDSIDAAIEIAKRAASAPRLDPRRSTAASGQR